jgi:uncharacterized protein (TIGR02271 family)
MAMHTITAMFHSRSDAERAASAIRQDSRLSASNVRVLPEADEVPTSHQDEGGFLASLRNFFMPEEDRYGYAEGMRRGDYLVAVDVENEHAHAVMDALENAGAIDMDAEEARWRTEGWRGFEPSSSASAAAADATTIPPVPGSSATDTTSMHGVAGTGTTGGRDASVPGSTSGVSGVQTPVDRENAVLGTGRSSGTEPTREAALGRDTKVGTGEERIPIAEERLKVGKRQVVEGRVRIRSYVVETPVTESVRLREERVDIERRPVDRPLTGAEADPFREREIEATEMREEPVVTKETRVREELVLHKSAEERDETVRDTVRRTEVREERDGDSDPAAPRTP